MLFNLLILKKIYSEMKSLLDIWEGKLALW
jgi:hypothetical protein